VAHALATLQAVLDDFHKQEAANPPPKKKRKKNATP
jgi:hypothetical protein